MDLRTLLSLKAAIGGSPAEKNLFNMDTFDGLSGITYSDGIAVATADSFNGGGHCYSLNERIPAGTTFTISVTAMVTNGAGADNWGLRVQAFFTDNTNADFWHYNELDDDWTTFECTYKMSKDVKGLRFSYGNYPFSVWHLKDIKVALSKPFNPIDYSEFLKNPNLTVNGTEVYGTNYNFRNNAQKYALKRTIPAGCKVKLTATYQSENNDGNAGGLVFRLGYTGSDSYDNVCTFANDAVNPTVMTTTAVPSYNCNNIQFGWNVGQNTIMHLTNINIDIVD